MDELLKAELANIKTGLESKTALEVKTQLEAFETKVSAGFKAAYETDIKAVKDELQGKLDAIQAHADKLDIKLQEKGSETKSVGFSDSLSKGLETSFNDIKSVSKGRNAAIKLDVKTVGDMTTAANLTGASVMTYQPGVVMVPSQKINFADLVPTVNSATGNYTIYRETGSEGSISEQTTPGASKTQIDYDLTNVTFVANYISGFARYAKQMAQDLPFLQSFLPNALRRDYFKKENATFFTALTAVATASTTAKTVDVEQLIDDMGTLESTDHEVTGIVLNPKDWAEISMTKPNDYSLPGTVTFQNGRLSINGTPVFKASWCPVDKYIVGDWSYAKKVVVDGLGVEFFEQDADNVTKNLITARVESRTVLAIDRPQAFIYGDFANVPSV